MKTITLMTALLLIASLGKAQTRLESEFQALEQTAIAADKKKVEDEKARQAAEVARKRLEAQELSRQLYAAEVGPLNAAIEAKFKHQKVASIHTPMRTVQVGRFPSTLDYVLIMTKLDNGMICQMDVHGENLDSQAFNSIFFRRFAFCVSDEGSYSLTATLNPKTGKIELSDVGSQGDYQQKGDEKSEWNKFSYLRQLDAEQDKAKKAGYARPATISCLEKSFAIRDTLYKSSAAYAQETKYDYLYTREPGLFDGEVSLLDNAIKKGTSLASLRSAFPGCFASVESR